MGGFGTIEAFLVSLESSIWNYVPCPPAHGKGVGVGSHCRIGELEFLHLPTPHKVLGVHLSWFRWRIDSLHDGILLLR